MSFEKFLNSRDSEKKSVGPKSDWDELMASSEQPKPAPKQLTLEEKVLKLRNMSKQQQERILGLEGRVAQLDGQVADILRALKKADQQLDDLDPHGNFSSIFYKGE